MKKVLGEGDTTRVKESDLRERIAWGLICLTPRGHAWTEDQAIVAAVLEDVTKFVLHGTVPDGVAVGERIDAVRRSARDEKYEELRKYVDQAVRSCYISCPDCGKVKEHRSNCEFAK